MIESTPRTIATLPFFASGRFPKPDLIGRCRDGNVETMSGREFVDRIRDLSLGLTGLGMTRGDRVALLAESRPEWLVADFAILMAGAVTTPIYPTLSAEQVAFILRDSDASLAIVSSAVQLAKVIAATADLPSLRTIVVMDANATGAASSVPIVAFDEVATRGHRRILDGWGIGREFQELAKSIAPDDLATIIYTSGTTGTPKGVMLTHGNLVANLAGVLDVLYLDQNDVALSFLPLCHGFERIVAYVYLATGVSMIFAESIDSVARDLRVVRPTVMTGVPRVFEKLYARIVETGRTSRGVKRAIFERALGVADARGARLPSGARLPLWLRVQSAIADRVVFSRVREGLGGRLRYAVSGSAPLDAGLLRFFLGVGFPILEGYGLTETAPVLTVMPLEAIRAGTVGPPLPNVELRLADDGEVLARGPNVMRGYYRRPEETAAVMTDGWFRTGDVGAFDEKGYLRLTDRKKELIVTSGGKKIAPQPIEARLCAHPLVAEAVVVGEGRKFAGVLIVPDFARLAERLGVDVGAARARVGSPEVRALYEPIIEGVNASLAQYERLKQFALIGNDFTMATGELTPTMKVKRRVVEQKYREAIEGLYFQASKILA